MNFDILIKLIKLANHNNADGEANAAARKVCKMLAEENYSWIEKAIKGGPKVAADKFDKGEWNRSPFTAYEDEVASWFRKWGSEFSEEARRRNEEYVNQQTRKEEEYRRAYNYAGQWYEEAPNYKEPDPKEQSRRDKKKKEGSKTNSQKEADERAKERRAEAKKKWEEWEKNRGPKQPINYTWQSNKGFKKVYIERLRRCVTCGFDRLTTDETPAYVCAKCKRS